jgi:hypothetical protein
MILSLYFTVVSFLTRTLSFEITVLSFEKETTEVFLSFFGLKSCAFTKEDGKTIVNNSKIPIFTIWGLYFTLNLYPRCITVAKIN